MYLARVMRSAAHEIRDILRAGTPTHGHLRDRVVGVAVATLAVDLACAALALLFEHGAKQTQVTSFGSAIGAFMVRRAHEIEHDVETEARRS